MAHRSDRQSRIQLPNGDYEIDAKGQTSGLTSSAKFTVGGTSVTLSTQSGLPGASVTANGSGFVPGDSVQIIVNGLLIDTQTADTNGNVTFTFTVPQVKPGNYLVVLSVFPYTKVNGSTFPAPNDQMKASTPPVSDPNYDANMAAFVQANVPNTYAGQQVAFYDYFYSQGGLTIWGAPISSPAPDPNNNGFIYQRFQRGIMHYIVGTGTESILVADYLKALILNQNVPNDLRTEAIAQDSPYLASYCPGAPQWMCKPNQVPGTDYTFAFVQG
jgi:hypothetical protein